jgi:hypothetical protein
VQFQFVETLRFEKIEQTRCTEESEGIYDDGESFVSSMGSECTVSNLS